MGAGHFKVILFSLCALAVLPSTGRPADGKPVPPAQEPGGGIWAGKVLDGSVVHTAGELQVNVTNWGVLGSFPGSTLPMSDAPSAQWPAGSGIEYLYAAGLWIGALVNGAPSVSTAIWDYELAPARGRNGTILASFEGAGGGNRFPSPFADDDGDSRTDEDPLDGLDNDEDGLVDEDFAATSNQMYSCRYWDNLPECLQDNPAHQPLDLSVDQETYQWETGAMRNCVGVVYTLTNEGHNLLEQAYLGLYVDPDIGARQSSRRHMDDRVDLIDTLVCVPAGAMRIPLALQLACAWDGDGDAGSEWPAPGWFGILLLGHTTDPLVETAPYQTGLLSWQVFRGGLPYGTGGEPTNDRQRYEVLSAPRWSLPPVQDGDYRALVSVGPFRVGPGERVRLALALVAGEGRQGLIENAVAAKLAYEGEWFDRDENPWTGTYCRETLLYYPDRKVYWTDPCAPMPIPMAIPPGWPIWVNADCAFEAYGNAVCDNTLPWCSGTGGRETQSLWLHDSPPPPPSLRVWAPEGACVLFWDDLSKEVPDPRSQAYDFEGFLIWRAEGWNRPLGSTVLTGPSTALWSLYDSFDLPNGLGRDTGLEMLIYQPNVDANLVAWYAGALLTDSRIETSRDLRPPIGYSLAEADTAITLARRELGMPGGRTYYCYADTRVHAGLHYFYSVTASDHIVLEARPGQAPLLGEGLAGQPGTRFVYVSGQSASQPAWRYEEGDVYVVPNPATAASMAPWTLQPNQSDPTGLKVEFRHLPAAPTTLRIYTLAGDLVQTLRHDGSPTGRHGQIGDRGTLTWDLVNRNGQDVVSGVYLFVVEAPGFPSSVGKFTVIR